MLKKRNAKVRNYKTGQLPVPNGDQRAKSFEPRWTRSWEITARLSKVLYNIVEPGTARKARKVYAVNLKYYSIEPDRFIPEVPLTVRSVAERVWAGDTVVETGDSLAD